MLIDIPRVVIAAPASAASAPTAKHSWNAAAVGIGGVPGASTWVWLVISAAITAPAVVVPIERIRVLRLFAAPVSEAGTALMMSAGIEP